MSVRARTDGQTNAVAKTTLSIAARGENGGIATN